MPARDRIIRPNTRRSRFENRRLHKVEGGGGLSLLVAEGGRPDGPPIILLHGFSQCHLCWYRQFEGRLAERFRLIAPDLRGHGGSAKPEERAAYSDGALWADDLAAVIETLGLTRPVVVAWSYAGSMVCDYLRHRGTAGIAGINFVGAVAKLGPDSVPLLGPDLLGSTPGLLSSDPGKNVVAARRFVRGTSSAPMSPDDNDMAMASTMMVPPAVRRCVLGRTEDYDDVLKTIDVPVLVTVGTSDVMVSPRMAEHIAEVTPNAVLSRYPAIGHAPFLEMRERFDRELAAFADSALAVAAKA